MLNVVKCFDAIRPPELHTSMSPWNKIKQTGCTIAFKRQKCFLQRSGEKISIKQRLSFFASHNLIKKIQQTHNEYMTIIAVKKKEKLLCNIFAELTFMRGKNL